MKQDLAAIGKSNGHGGLRLAGAKYLAPVILILAEFLWLSIPVVFAQSSTFTYQGRLQDGGTAANGSYDFQFTLWDAALGGTQQPQPGPVTETRTGVQVANGVFTTQLDFGATAFPGANRYLETSVRLAGGGAFTILSPRQQITGTPYAIRSASASAADTATSATNATAATNALNLGGVAASQYVLTGDARLSDARDPLPGSANYIQNQVVVAQPSTNFNISGTGLANIFTATTQFNIQSSRVLSIAGSNNLFVGPDAGFSNTSGHSNTFVGNSAGYSNSTGRDNSFFGYGAGRGNTDGGANSSFGSDAGRDNTDGTWNSFFGSQAGLQNSTGNANSFFGSDAGLINTTGGNNSFFGRLAGRGVTGNRNSFFGSNAGVFVTTGDNNTLIGANSDAEGGISNATAIGAQAEVSQNNSLVLGSINGVNNATADTRVGIGITAPSNRLHVVTSLNAVATTTGHVALIENTSTGTSPDVLALKIGRTTDPDSSNNFITFFNGNDASVGSIQGNGNGGVLLGGPGSDYAEWLPRLDPKESIQPGDVVGLFNGRISKVTNQASQVMVVSTGAIVAGNDPGITARATHSLVAFIGQARARVKGTVQAGDFIVPSGRADGVGIAVSPERITAEQFAQVLGQAWETSTSTGIKQVRVAVGLIRHDPTVKRLLAQSRQQAAQIGLLQEKTAQIGLLQEKMAELEARLVASERTMQIIGASSSKRRSTKTAGSQNSTAPAYTLRVIRKAKLASTR